jgi:peptidoglycan/xylan/chitin deacetylase (PgdA/CDA1 family)
VFKDALAPVAQAVALRLTAGSARVLMYHRFGSSAYGSVAADVFEQQLRYLRDRMQVIRLSELVSRLEHGEKLGSRVAVITVDDGYSDFVTVAAPLLRRYRLPAALFPVTSFVDRQAWLWFDALRYLVTHAEPGSYRAHVVDEEHSLSIEAPRDRRRAWSIVARRLMAATVAQRAEVIAELARELRVALPAAATSEYAAATWEQLRSLEPELFEIGCHSANHPQLTLCKGGELDAETLEPKRLLEERLQRSIDLFCYPTGMPGDYDAATRTALVKAGFRAALLAHGGLVRPATDPMQIPRIGAPVELRHFRSAVSGLDQLRGNVSL